MEKRFCPDCGSDRVEPDTENSAEIYFSGGNLNKWRCRECGYVGIMPEGDPEEPGAELEFEDESSGKKVDVDFGIGYMKFVLYIVLPLAILYILYLSL